MTRYRTSWLAAMGLAVLGLFVTGCERGFIDDAARRSLASFIVDVVQTAVNGTIVP